MDGKGSWQDRIAFLGGRCKERREDSYDAGVHGHKESTKTSPKLFLGGDKGWSASQLSVLVLRSVLSVW